MQQRQQLCELPLCELPCFGECANTGSANTLRDNLSILHYIDLLDIHIPTATCSFA